MRKLFVIALLVALIPFTTGCRVGGLWGFDDDSGSNIGCTAAHAASAAKSSVVFTQNVTLASSAVKLTAAVLWTDIPLVLGTGANAITIYPTSYATDTNNNIVLKYTKTITTTELTAAVPTYSAADGSKAVAYTIVYAGISISGSVNLDNRTTDTTAATTVNVMITGSTTTGFSISVTSTTGPTGATSTGATVTTTTVTSTALQAALTIDSVQFGGANLGVDTTNLVTVNTLTPKFTVNFSNATAWTSATTWTMIVTNVTSGNAFTLTSTSDAALFTIASSGTKLDITVGTAAGKALKTGQTYKVEFSSSNLKNTAGTAVALPAYRYFKTNTAVTTMSGFTVANALTTAPVVTLTFSGNIKTGQAYTGAVTLERYADENYTNKEATMTIDQSNATFSDATAGSLIITFNQAFVLNKYYKVIPSTGSILDAANTAVSLPPYLTFQVK